MIKFTNPRLEAVIENWPLGGSKRGTAVFKVEQTISKGMRVSRTTTGKPKPTTYSDQMRIVDGDNGKTYILSLSTKYGMSITVKSSDMQHDASREEIGGDHYVTPTDPNWGELFFLFQV
jgi:hypothetical protein